MKRLVRIVLLSIILSLALTAIAYAQDGTEPGTSGASAGQVALLLAPLVAAATAIERVIEMGFSFFEGLWLRVAKVPDTVNDYVGWARKQVGDARAAFKRPQENPKWGEIEDRLLDAQKRLENVLKMEPYKSIKQVLSLVAGIVLGLIVAFTTRLRMFELLGADLVKLSQADPNAFSASFLTTMDIIVTGLVIGTGSAPVHSLIGILQKSKDTIEEARALTLGKAKATAAAFRETTSQQPGGGVAFAMDAGAEGEAPSQSQAERSMDRWLER